MRAKEPALAIEQAERTLAQNPTDESALYQELLAKRRLGQTGSLDALTARLVAARQANALKQQKVDRYQLQGKKRAMTAQPRFPRTILGGWVCWKQAAVR